VSGRDYVISTMTLMFAATLIAACATVAIKRLCRGLLPGLPTSDAHRPPRSGTTDGKNR